MKGRLEITINGKEYEAEAGATILDVIRKHRIDDIPTLCDDPKLPPYGSCYLCVVEVEGQEKLVPSCSSPVLPGMVIHTSNERIRESRKTALELLLSNHYADCLAPCTLTCPAGVDVQGYIALISMGKHREAVRLIKEKNPLPLVCGRVCVRDCETACRRNLVDDRVGIDYLKRYASDQDMIDPWIPEVPARNGKRVAIVGGGPAGLTAAYFLTLRGYDCTIFDGASKLGGMLRYGIPEYRLPKAVLDREVKWITDLGVTVETNSALGKDFTLQTLKETGFDATFLAIGAQKAKQMGLAGEDTTEGIIGGIDFLRQMQGKDLPSLYGTVVVVGGGNTAIDAARTALRRGAKGVFILYRRTLKEMPAHQAEIDAAIEEGVDILFLSAPTAIVAKDGRVEALRCCKMELGEPDESGRRSTRPIAGSDYDLECDFVIAAIGQDVEPLGAAGENGLATTRGKAIIANEVLATTIPGVFAGGDAITGPAVAIDAIAHGRKAAIAIDHYVTTGAVTRPGDIGFISRKETFGSIAESELRHVLRVEKECVEVLLPAERISSLAEVERGFTETQALNESGRCLACGCSAYFDCDLRRHASDFGVDISKFVGDTRRHKIDTTHPLIALDPNKCINCGRCVRTCSEVLSISALGFVHRGFKSVVKPSMEKPLLKTNCISCGNCIAACPTGAITEKLPFQKPGPWAFEEVQSICSFCSLGCNLNYRVFHDGLFTVSKANGTSHNKGYLCSKGRFGYRYMMEKDRVLVPMIRRRGEWQQTTWDDALSYAAQRLKAVAAASGVDSIATLASPKMTNEDLYLLQRFVRTGLKNNNIGSFDNVVNGPEQDTLDDMMGTTVSTATMDDLASADIILVVNTDFLDGNLVMELKIKSARRQGSMVVTISSSEIPLVRSSDLWVDTKRGTNTALINGVCKTIIDRGLDDRRFIDERTEGYERFGESVAPFDIVTVSDMTGVKRETLRSLFDLLSDRTQSLVIIYSIDTGGERSKNDLKALANLMMLTGRLGRPGSGIVILRAFANSQGLLDMGVDPRYLPGQVRWDQADRTRAVEEIWASDLQGLFKPMDLRGSMEQERIKALLVFGEDPLRATSSLKLASGAQFLLVVESFMTPTAMEADVILPAPLPIEFEGSITACDRRVQKVTPLSPPKTGWDYPRIINGLAEKMGIPVVLATRKQIEDEIRKTVPLYGTRSKGVFWGNGLFDKAFMTPTGKAQFAIPFVDVTPYNVSKRYCLHDENYFELKIKSRLAT
jgi:formate dehydrogenase major subunit